MVSILKCFHDLDDFGVRHFANPPKTLIVNYQLPPFRTVRTTPGVPSIKCSLRQGSSATSHEGIAGLPMSSWPFLKFFGGAGRDQRRCCLGDD